MKELWIFLYDTCVISEITMIPWFLQSEQDLKVKMVASEKKIITSYEGYSITPGFSLDELTLSDGVVGLLFPGGVDVFLTPKLTALIKKMDADKKLLGGICAGPEFLARAGILNRHQYTCSNSVENYTDKGEIDPFPRENYVEHRSVQDSHVITAKGEAFLDFADLILQYFNFYTDDQERKSFMSNFIPNIE